MVLAAFLDCTLPCFLRQGLSPSLELNDWLDWLANELYAILSPPLKTGIAGARPTPVCLHGSWGSELTFIPTADTLSTGPSP